MSTTTIVLPDEEYNRRVTKGRKILESHRELITAGEFALKALLVLKPNCSEVGWLKSAIDASNAALES